MNLGKTKKKTFCGTEGVRRAFSFCLGDLIYYIQKTKETQKFDDLVNMIEDHIVQHEKYLKSIVKRQPIETLKISTYDFKSWIVLWDVLLELG